MKNTIQLHTINIVFSHRSQYFAFFHIKKEQFLLKSNNTAYIHTLKASSHAEKYILSLFINKQSTENALESQNSSVQLLESPKSIINIAMIDG